MKYLVDANLLSEPTKPLVCERAVEWLRNHQAEFAVDSIVIAATAKHHGLIVATRNVDDFMRCGVPAVNPFV